MAAARVIVVSDTPLSPAAPEAAANWDFVFRHIRTAAPDVVIRQGGTDHLWAPTTWAVLPEDIQPTLGAKRCGIVALEFAAGRQPEPDFVEPDGIAQLTVARDIPDPYHR